MKRQILSSLVGLTVCVIWFFASSAWAAILVVSPHPDDDLLIASGTISRAIAAGETVIVAYVTNGDYSGGTAMGYQREGEAVNTETTYLGNTENNLIFLGYPDYYTQTLYQDYPLQSEQFTTPNNKQSTTYGNRGLGRSDYHTYKFGHPAPYNFYYMVMDLAQIIEDYKPDHIITTSKYDAHPDHSTAYYLVGLALQSAMPSMPGYSPTVHTTIVHTVFPPVQNSPANWPLAMDPTQYMTEPPILPSTTLVWGQRESLDVTVPMQSTTTSQNPKYLALQSLTSQSSSFWFLEEFVHKDEILWIDTTLGGPHHAPVASAGTDQQVAPDAAVTLNGSASWDPDGNTMTYAWTQIAGTAVQLTGANTASPTFTAPAQSGELTFKLVVSDGYASSLSDEVNVIVQPPAISKTGWSLLYVDSQETVGENAPAVDAFDNNSATYWHTQWYKASPRAPTRYR